MTSKDLTTGETPPAFNHTHINIRANCLHSSKIRQQPHAVHNIPTKTQPTSPSNKASCTASISLSGIQHSAAKNPLVSTYEARLPPSFLSYASEAKKQKGTHREHVEGTVDRLLQVNLFQPRRQILGDI